MAYTVSYYDTNLKRRVKRHDTYASKDKALKIARGLRKIKVDNTRVALRVKVVKSSKGSKYK